MCCCQCFDICYFCAIFPRMSKSENRRIVESVGWFASIFAAFSLAAGMSVSDGPGLSPSEAFLGAATTAAALSATTSVVARQMDPEGYVPPAPSV